MLCRNVFLVAFYHGDGDKELSDNIEALKKKLAGRMKGEHAVSVFEANVPKGLEGKTPAMVRDAVGAKLEQVRETPDNGLYLIIHSGPTQSNPPGRELGAIVAEAFFNDGIRLRKINLAGCTTAGTKAGNVGGSVLRQFCDALLQGVRAPEALVGTAACGYQAEVTTYDEGSEYYQQLVLKGFKMERPPTKAVHNVVQNRGEKRLFTTHPTVSPEDAQGIRVAYQNAYEGIHQADGAATKLKRLGVTGLDAAKDLNALPPEKLEKYFAEYYNLGRRKAQPPQLEQRLKDLIGAYQQYLRLKIVLKFDPAQKRFVPGSLAEYSDNATVQSMVTVVDRYEEPTKLLFHL
ncbi:MAG TPA: hypothetical protein VFQ38_13090 [Longimicrobiales bacterium]|nr:hypothetical protein [Longimicrobiales bacterium]